MALRADSGEELWRQQAAGDVRIAPTVDGDRLYIPTVEGRISARDLLTGAELWSRMLGGSPTDIVATGDRLYVGSKDNFFYSIDTANGRLRWRWRAGADVVGAAVLDESRVYFAALDNLLRALDRYSGVQRWK